MMAPSIAIAKPINGMPVIERITYSPPAHIEHNDMLAEKKIAKPISLLLGIRFCFPAIKKSPHRRDINTEDNATFKGDRAPKNSAISLPDENPAPIAVPMYRNAVLKDCFIQKNMLI